MSTERGRGLPHFGPLPDNTYRRREASVALRLEIARRKRIIRESHIAVINVRGQERAKHGYDNTAFVNAPVKIHR